MELSRIALRAGVLATAVACVGILAQASDAHAVGCGAGSLDLSNVQITSIDGNTVGAINATCSAGPISGNSDQPGVLLNQLNTNNIFTGYTEDIWQIAGTTSFTPTAGDPAKGGTWSVDFSPNEYSIFALALKGATSFGVYLFDLSPVLAGLVGGDYKMTGIIVPGPSGNIADLSNLVAAVYPTSPTTAIPVPASLPLLLAALGGIGMLTRRRRVA